MSIQSETSSALAYGGHTSLTPSPEDPIEVAFCVDRPYYIHAAAALQSICANHDGSAIRVLFVVDRSVEVDRDLVRRIAKSHPEVRIEWIEVELSRFASFPSTASFPISVYTRLLLAEALPLHAKVLYLDADVIVCAPLRSFWSTDVSRVVLGAVRDPISVEFQSGRIPKPDEYFNSGVLLMNLDRWRADDVTAELCQFLTRSGDSLVYFDQDALNNVLLGRVRFLSYKWNFQPRFADLSAAELGISMGEYRNLRSSPGIVHFTSTIKPWKHPERIHYSSLYIRARAGVENGFDPRGTRPSDWARTAATSFKWRWPTGFQLLRRSYKRLRRSSITRVLRRR